MESSVSNSPNMYDLFQARRESITANMSQVNSVCIAQIAVLRDITLQIANNCFPLSLDASAKFSVDILPLLAERLRELSKNYPQPEAFVVVPDEMLDSVRNLEPFVPEEQREEFENLVAPPRDGKAKKLPANTFIGILGIILQIIIVLQNNASGLQTETFIEQNYRQIELQETIIRQNDTQIEIDKEKLDLERRKADALERIGDILQFFYDASGELLDPVKPFGEQESEFRDPVESGGQYYETDAYDDIPDKQE